MKTKPKRQLSVRAIALLRRTMKAIAKEPAAYNQHVAHIYYDKPACGSAACICGWLMYFRWMPLTKRQRDAVSYQPASAFLTREQWNRLFHYCLWPARFRKSVGHPTAETAVKRIQHFIDTDGEK